MLFPTPTPHFLQPLPSNKAASPFPLGFAENGPDSRPSIIPAVPIPTRDVPTKPSPSLLFRQALHFLAAPSHCCSSPGL